jgi:hypothetical protein
MKQGNLFWGVKASQLAVLALPIQTPPPWLGGGSGCVKACLDVQAPAKGCRNRLVAILELPVARGLAPGGVCQGAL